ncbi:hypothetical protein ACVC7V_08735 [Hydrogenophaga sp. A37]|nr:hypothetical protein [Hydrogenophaga sp. A37]
MNQAEPILQFLGCLGGVWGLSLLTVCDAANPPPKPHRLLDAARRECA